MADDGWVYVEWQGDLSGSENPKTVTVTSDLAIVAVFGERAEVETDSVSDMRVNSVTGGGDVEDNGGFEITEFGVCWTTEGEFPNTADDCTTDGDGLGSFTSDITGLTQGLTYYARAYATNKAGTAYGETVEFRAGYVSHGYVDGVTPSNNSDFKSRSYKLVESNWKGGVNRVWAELNLGANNYVKTVTDSNAHRAGWYFQFNRKQGHYHNGDVKVPDAWDDNINEDSDWEAENDPAGQHLEAIGEFLPVRNGTNYRVATSSVGGMQGGDYNNAFDSLLRLHTAGALDDNAALQYSGSAGLYWSSNQEDSDTASFLGITSSGSNIGADGDKSAALTVRCLKN